MSGSGPAGSSRRSAATGRCRRPRAPAARARLAVHVVLADQRLRADRAARVLAEGSKPWLGHARRDERVRRRLLVTSKSVVLPARTPADLEVAAARQAEGVVEDDLVRLACAACSLGAQQRPRRPRRPAITRREDAARFIRPPACSDGVAGEAGALGSERTFEPSGAALVGAARAAVVDWPASRLTVRRHCVGSAGRDR